MFFEVSTWKHCNIQHREESSEDVETSAITRLAVNCLLSATSIDFKNFYDREIKREFLRHLLSCCWATDELFSIRRKRSMILGDFHACMRNQRWLISDLFDSIYIYINSANLPHAEIEVFRDNSHYMSKFHCHITIYPKSYTRARRWGWARQLSNDERLRSKVICLRFFSLFSCNHFEGDYEMEKIELSG